VGVEFGMKEPIGSVAWSNQISLGKEKLEVEVKDEVATRYMLSKRV